MNEKKVLGFFLYAVAIIGAITAINASASVNYNSIRSYESSYIVGSITSIVDFKDEEGGDEAEPPEPPDNDPESDPPDVR